MIIQINLIKINLKKIRKKWVFKITCFFLNQAKESKFLVVLATLLSYFDYKYLAKIKINDESVDLKECQWWQDFIGVKKAMCMCTYQFDERFKNWSILLETNFFF